MWGIFSHINRSYCSLVKFIACQIFSSYASNISISRTSTAWFSLRENSKRLFYVLVTFSQNVSAFWSIADIDAEVNNLPSSRSCAGVKCQPLDVYIMKAGAVHEDTRFQEGSSTCHMCSRKYLPVICFGWRWREINVVHTGKGGKNGAEYDWLLSLGRNLDLLVTAVEPSRRYYADLSTPLALLESRQNLELYNCKLGWR